MRKTLSVQQSDITIPLHGVTALSIELSVAHMGLMLSVDRGVITTQSKTTPMSTFHRET